LTPAEGLPRRVEPPLPCGAPPDPAERDAVNWEGYQFTLSELLLLTAAVALVLSVLSSINRLLPGAITPKVFAGLLGVGALCCLIAGIFFQPRRPIVVVGWYVLVVLYLVACVVATLAGE
jgi:drug/metabolite transporter (DMT)-like permease